MKDRTLIRPIVRADLPALKRIIASTDLFPPDMLEGMMEGHWNGSPDPALWLTYGDPHPLAIAYAAPEPMTDGCWNLYLIAVHADHHGQGIGRLLMAYVEDTLAVEGVRVLLVETSGDDGFARTRNFYRQSHYEEEACIREFYAAGEDKIVFRKAL
ncbi:MAG: GNAT family N-acetyltransferase [Rhizobiales bacterium]|nr:GNAT family N-acetyltransferase [Hyphomicrobiales bacterium]MBO6699840.1 GNAT family N-acetyltransferase [Hyphomicrobiales bacterium]MBO6737378.1 GNAT family N-acetyltransferase [Hyphomicrobiales bacterium]MBO6911548.1 GNAT family N-acetyltransferase [Hyphomicrobiales bacterium]MBO6955152.1 GNAT family N-acetyltransferase [Hyphomicrobiales bacterium]